MKKRIFAGGLSVIMLTGCSQISPESLLNPVEMPVEYEPYDVVEPEYEYLDFSELEWYSDFCNQLLNYETQVVVDGNIPRNDLDKAFRKINSDIPDVFWLGPAWLNRGSKHTTVEFKLQTGCTEDNIRKMHDELEEKAAEIIEGFPKNSTDYDKVLYLHDYIAKNTEYDSSIDYETGAGLCYTAYGCLVQGKAVCQGYAEAFTYIMNKMGIETGVVQGSSYPGGHAWNYVCLDGEYYWLDITWDDKDRADFPVEYGYFLFTDEMQSRTRKVDFEENFIPKCTSLKYNYFAKNESLLNEYDFDSVKAVWDNKGGKAYTEVMFADFESYNSAIEDLFVKNNSSKLDNMRIYYRDDRNYTITFSEG